MLVAIADAGSFRAAAKRVHRAQSAVSHAIATLESQLGIELFDRDGYRATLTDEGRVLLGDARRVIAQAEGLRARARSFRTGVEATLDIAIDPFIRLDTFAAALRVVHERYSQVAVRVHAAPMGGPLVAVRDGGSSFGLSVSDEFHDDALHMEPAGRITLVAVAAPGHAVTRAASPADVSDQLNIVIADPTTLTAGVDYGVGGPRAWRVDDLETKRALLIAGVGWGSMPLHVVEDDIAAGRLSRIAPQGIGPGGETPMPVYLIRRKGIAPGPAAACFRDVLLGAAGSRT